MQPSSDIARLIEIIAALRTPGSGCPWDLQQNFDTIVPFTLEEAYEVADAVHRGNLEDLRDELGDLLLQVVFYARMAEEQKAFDFGGVVEAITSKMIRRHPHVFGDVRDLSPEAIKGLWAEIKASEKAAKAASQPGMHQPYSGILADIAITLPGLIRAVKLQEKAARAGFDWTDIMHVIKKIREETDEVEEALKGDDPEAVAEEIGDLFFAVTSLARHRHRDPEMIMRAANAKFERRFRYIEDELARRGQPFSATSLQEMEEIWIEAKTIERQGKT